MLIVSEAEITIITDQGMNTGTGRYAFAVYNLLKEDFPNMCILQLAHVKSVPIPNAIRPSFIRPARNLLLFPIQKRRNLKMIKSHSHFLNSNLHLCGSDYSLTSESENCICTVHDYFFRFPNADSFRNRKELLSEIYIDYYNLLTPRQIKRCSGIVVSSFSAQRDMLKKLGLKSKVVHFWADDNFKQRNKDQSLEKLELPKGKKLLLNVSGAGANKNLPTLQRIADILPADFAIVKVGHPIDHPRVINVGTVSAADYPHYFNSVSVYVNTSLQEGFCIPLIESLSSGLPIVSPKIPPFDEILGDAAAYVRNPIDEREYLDQVMSVLEEAERQKLSSKSLERGKKFSKESAKPSLIEMYKQCFKL